jgi:hypothetical protein
MDTEVFVGSSMVEALASDAPHPDIPPEQDFYGRFVGSWDFDFTGYGTDGTVTKAVGEWHFGRALDGRAIVDVWICPSRAERRRDGSPAGEYGATVRFFDSAAGAWRVTWSGPAYGAVRTFLARREGDEIVQRGETPEGHPLHWIFSDIEGDSFHWRSEVSEDGGSTWRVREEFEVSRRPAE